MQRLLQTFRARTTLALLLSVATAASLTLVPAPAAAVGGPGYDPPTPEPVYEPTGPGLTYTLQPRAHKWVGAWRSRDDITNKPWDVETYDPDYVHPKSFPATFRTQCTDKDEWIRSMDGGPTVNTYRWTVETTVLNRKICDTTILQFPGEGIFHVKLEVIDPQQTIIVTKQRLVRVKDHLIVLFGDSAASGEGSPESERTGDAVWGSWVDRRCHRSTKAAVPRAVQALEDADPHSTVTFLNFACSGATIERWTDEVGSGVLGRYNGIEPPYDGEYIGDWAFLPSQVDQLELALGLTSNEFLGAPARSVDKLFISGGINDVNFSTLATVCILYSDCQNKSLSIYSSDAVKLTYESFASQIPSSYGRLAEALDEASIDVKQGYAMEYPDPLTDATKKLCTSILGDAVPPSAVAWLLFLLASPVGLPFLGALITLSLHPDFQQIWPIIISGLAGTLHWDADEIKWLNATAMPRLFEAVKDGAALAGFTYIGGIAELFRGHGYCSTKNWLRRAPESSFAQGPWNIFSKPIPGGFNVHALTKGTIHPTPAGYAAISKLLTPHLADLINKAPVGVAENYTVEMNTTFDTGFGIGVLLNDSDPDGDELEARLIKAPKHGTAVLSRTGHLQYTPKTGYVGKDELIYRATDGGLESGDTRVSFQVFDPRSRPPQFDWTFPSEPPTVERGATVDIPICSRCGNLILRPVELPLLGEVALLALDNETWIARYTAPIATVAPEPLDEFTVGAFLDGLELDRARIGIRIVEFSSDLRDG
jgi:hypothetical protein